MSFISFDKHHLELLLRWLMYNCDDARTYYALCLVNKYCGGLAREYAPMKKKEFSLVDNFVIVDNDGIKCKHKCIFLPNGLAHGIWRFDNDNYIPAAYKDGFSIPFNCSVSEHHVQKAGKYIIIYNRSVYINNYYEIYVYDHWKRQHSIGKHIIHLKCPCRKPHIFITTSWSNLKIRISVIYACKCDESELKWYKRTDYNTSFDKYLYGLFQTRKTRIREALVKYAKLMDTKKGRV